MDQPLSLDQRILAEDMELVKMMDEPSRGRNPGGAGAER
jgi:hypothetical protein